MSAAITSIRSLRLVALLAAVTLAAAALAASPAGAAPGPDWAPVDDATITPGVQVITETGQCTANFVFVGGGDVFIGMAAHCAGTGGSTATNGCDAGSLPLGSEVTIEGASQPGTLAYSSWLTMQQVGEDRSEPCEFNDFALVLVDLADHASVNPSVPFWGGPTGLNTDGTGFGEDVFSYGNSSLRLGLEALSPKRGVSLGTNAGGWNHPVYTLTPGVPGDSGSAFLDAQGRALGSLSTLQLAPLAGANGVSDLARALDYARDHGNFHVELAEGTEAFTPRLLPLGLLG